MAQVTPRASIPYPDLTDVPNAQTAFQNMLTAIDTQMIARYATPGALPGTSTSGQLAYVTSNNSMYISQGGASWTRQSRATYYVKPSDTTRTLTTTLTADPFFVIPLEASTSYVFDCHFFFFSDAGVDFKSQWTLPAGNSNTIHHFAPDIATTNINSHGEQYNAYTASAVPVWGSASSSPTFPEYAKQTMVVVTGVTAGNATLTWAQNVSSALGTTLAMDSFVKVTRL